MPRPQLIRDGDRYGRFTVQAEGGRDKYGRRSFICICDCGTEKEIRGDSLRNGGSRSCGCLRREICSEKGLAQVGRKKPLEECRSYGAVHSWLSRHAAAEKVVCEFCGRDDKRLEWAYVGEGSWSASREDYRVLCVKCHRNLDLGKGTDGPVH